MYCECKGDVFLPQRSVTVLGSESIEESTFVVQLKHAAFPFNLRPHRETQQGKGLTCDPLLIYEKKTQGEIRNCMLQVNVCKHVTVCITSGCGYV